MAPTVAGFVRHALEAIVCIRYKAKTTPLKHTSSNHPLRSSAQDDGCLCRKLCHNSRRRYTFYALQSVNEFGSSRLACYAEEDCIASDARHETDDTPLCLPHPFVR